MDNIRRFAMAKGVARRRRDGFIDNFYCYFDRRLYTVKKEMKRESLIKAEVLKFLGLEKSIMIWNNPTGVAKTMDGKRVIKFGLEGSADIMGVQAVTITPDMIGQTIGRLVAIETKTKTGKQRKQQSNFQKAIEARGALYILARDIADVKGLKDDTK